MLTIGGNWVYGTNSTPSGTILEPKVNFRRTEPRRFLSLDKRTQIRNRNRALRSDGHWTTWEGRKYTIVCLSRSVGSAKRQEMPCLVALFPAGERDGACEMVEG